MRDRAAEARIHFGEDGRGSRSSARQSRFSREAGSQCVMTSLYKSTGPDVELALGAVVSEECRRLDLSPWTVATRGESGYSTVKAFKRGKRQPNLAGFITLAWSLHEEPRELFDKLLTAMNAWPST